MTRKKVHFGKAVLCGLLTFCLALALSLLLLNLQGKTVGIEGISALLHTYLDGETAENGTLTVLRTPQEMAQESIPHYETRWMLQNLSEDDLRNFVTLYQYTENAIFGGETGEWVLLPVPTTDERVGQLIDILQAECPELVTLNRKENLTWHYKNANGMISVSFPVLSDGKAMQEACNQVIAALLEQTGGMTDAEKERYVYDYLMDSIIYDTDTQWAGSAYGALVEHRAKCDGVSAAFKWVMEEMGIPALTVTARPEEGDGHAWNMICLENRWYTVDVTMDLHHEEDPEPHENGYYVYNASTRWARCGMTMDDFGVPLPEADTMNESWHVKNGSFLRSEEEAVRHLQEALSEILPGDAPESTRIRFQFQKAADMTLFLSELDDLIRDALADEDIPDLADGEYRISTMEEYHTVDVLLNWE